MEKLKCVRGAKPSMTEKYINEGSTVIYIAVEKVLTGYIVLSDTIRKESKAMIKELKKIAFKQYCLQVIIAAPVVLLQVSLGLVKFMQAASQRTSSITLVIARQMILLWMLRILSL